jgi:hypothetical protein
MAMGPTPRLLERNAPDGSRDSASVECITAVATSMESLSGVAARSVSETNVENLGLPVPRQHDVRSLQVPMHYTGRMRLSRSG